MSYDIYIGEAVIDAPDPAEHNDLDIVVKGLLLPDAPTFPNDETTGNGNGRSPGYLQWSDFCREAGIYDLFFDEEEGMMRRHPGCFLLRQRDLDRVRSALDRWRTAHPGTVPGFGNSAYFAHEIEHRSLWMEARRSLWMKARGWQAWSDFCRASGISDLFFDEEAAYVAQALDEMRKAAAGLPASGEYDPILARLIWLEWWMTWALRECKVPAIHNA